MSANLMVWIVDLAAEFKEIVGEGSPVGRYSRVEFPTSSLRLRPSRPRRGSCAARWTGRSSRRATVPPRTRSLCRAAGARGGVRARAGGAPPAPEGRDQEARAGARQASRVPFAPTATRPAAELVRPGSGADEP